ncbi:hypothetical protein [Pontibacter liquoris]|uniref:hypothetical protein n=1 Tax=Pontibacter liquoris TaxID=2905677 RepID=UPI001FA6B989|nr:hypothetical protein [Pontibacter liquoris]
MANTDDIILRIKVDEAAEQKKLVDLRKNINLVKEEQKQLAAAIKEAGGATDAQIQKQLQLEGTLKDLQGEQRNTQRVMENLDKVYKSNEGSITQLRAKLSVLTDQWNNLSDEERKNAEIGGVLEKRTKEISDELKTLEARVGDNRRSVGAYTEGILNAADGSGKLSGVIGTLQKVYGEAKDVIIGAKEAIQAEAEAKLASKAATEGSTIATNINKAAVIGNVAALKLLKFALIATGIGAFLVVIGGLISYLTRTQEGIDTVSAKMKGFTTVIGVIVDQLSAAGKATLDWFNGIEDFGDLLEKLGRGALNAFITRIKGLGVLLQGLAERDFTKIQDGIAQTTIGVTDASAKSKAWAENLDKARLSAEAVERETQRLRDAERQLNVDREKANVLIEKNKKLADDTSQSEAVRIKAAKEADKALQEITKRQLQLQKERIANIVAENRLTETLTEGNDKLAEANAKLYQLEAQSTTRSIELQNKLNSIRKEGAAKARDAAVKQLEAEAALLDIRTQNSLNSERDMLDLRLQLVRANLKKELLAEGLTAQQVKVLRAKAAQEEADLRAAYEQQQAQEKTDAEEQRLKLQLANAKKYVAEGSAAAMLELKQQRAEGLLDEQTYQAKLQNAAAARMVAEIVAMEQFRGKVVGIEEEITARQLELSNYLADQRIANNQKVEQQEAESAAATKARLQKQGEVTAAMIAHVGDLFSQSLTQQGMDMEKFTQGIMFLLLDTLEKATTAAVLQATLKTTAEALSSPDSVATFGIAGLAKAALITGLIKGAFALFRSQIASTLTTDTPKVFASGGFTGPGAGTADKTGFKVAGVVHENEYVAPAWMVEHPIYGAAIQQLEHIRLGGYANGGYTSLPRVTAPLASSNMMAPPRGVDFDYERLAATIAKLKVVASVKEITSKADKYTAKLNVVQQ